MNDNQLNHGERQDTYRATTNLNTAIENPQVNINSAIGVNIQNADTTHFTNDSFSNNSSFDNNMNQFGMNANDDTDSNRFAVNDSIHTNIDSSSYNNNMNHNSYNDNVYTDNFSSQVSSNVDGSMSHLGNQFIMGGNEKSDEEFTSYDTAIYEPTLEEKKRQKKGITIPSELKVLIFIVFILLIFILLMPSIYDFFKNLQLVITG